MTTLILIVYLGTLAALSAGVAVVVHRLFGLFADAQRIAGDLSACAPRYGRVKGASAALGRAGR